MASQIRDRSPSRIASHLDRRTLPRPAHHPEYEVIHVRLSDLRANPRNARTHSKKQIGQIAASIREFGFTSPVLTDETGMLLAGHGRFDAAQLLGLKTIPAIAIADLSEARKRALLLADNKIAQNAGWNREQLAIELEALPELLAFEDLDVSITGFEPVEIDTLAADFEQTSSDPADAFDPSISAAMPVSQRGDVWQLGKSRLLCGDARDANDLNSLMGGKRAHMAFLDPPYNVLVKGIVGRGKIKRAEFAMASGEMSSEKFRMFLTESLAAAAKVSSAGAVHFVCMD